MPIHTTIITSVCECACMHMPILNLVPRVPRTCPDVEPFHGTSEKPAVATDRRGLLACGSTVPRKSERA